MTSTTARQVAAKINHRREKTLTSIVREAIEQMITAGELQPGDRINESTLAAELSVSRGPVREACRNLEQAGLIISNTNQGFFIREMTLDELRNLYEVRGALAGLIGRLVAERAKEENFIIFRELIDQMDLAAHKHQHALYYSLNLTFHNALVEAAANPALRDSYRWIIGQICLYRHRSLVQPENLKVSNAEHKQILKALEAKDASAAEAAVRLHVSQGWHRLSAVV